MLRVFRGLEVWGFFGLSHGWRMKRFGDLAFLGLGLSKGHRESGHFGCVLLQSPKP